MKNLRESDEFQTTQQEGSKEKEEASSQNGCEGQARTKGAEQMAFVSDVSCDQASVIAELKATVDELNKSVADLEQIALRQLWLEVALSAEEKRVEEK